jgi:pimeloyl-ACP methyl ester carboxylesterase
MTLPAREQGRTRQNDPIVVTRDGRRLAAAVSGAPHGTPVFLMHGTPGSRNGPKPRSSICYRLGVSLISYDRPGYGLSTKQPGRTVADAAADVAAIADALGIDRFAVAGRSGGGPHALAVAALLPDRVTRTAVLVGLAPANAPNLDWYEGMTRTNVDTYTVAEADSAQLAENLRQLADSTNRDPESLINSLRTQMNESDRRVVEDVAIRRLLVDTYAEAVRLGPNGWIDDVLALRADWGFGLDSIASPVRIWHGAEDTFSPVSHARWLAAQIPLAVIDIQSGTAHFGAVEILPEILAWLTTAGRERNSL